MESKQQSMLQITREIMLQQARVYDAQVRVAMGLNSLLDAIEAKDTDNINASERNLNLQIFIAGKLFNIMKIDPITEYLEVLKNSFKESISCLKPKQLELIDKHVQKYYLAFDSPVELPKELLDFKGFPTDPKQREAMLFSLIYSNMMNDEIHKESETANSFEELTVFKQTDSNSKPNESFGTFEMKNQYSKVFKRHAKDLTDPNYKLIETSSKCSDHGEHECCCDNHHISKEDSSKSSDADSDFDANKTKEPNIKEHIDQPEYIIDFK